MTASPKLDPNKYLEKYFTFDELTAALQGFTEMFPNLAKLESIGKSYEGRDLWVLIVTNFATGAAEAKPAYWIDANIHASEVTGGAVALYTIAYLLGHYGQASQPEGEINVTRLLDSRAFYIMPRHTPDGVERVLTSSYRLRSSTRPYPYDEDRDGLYQTDLDGDGSVRQMRIVDPNGDWKVSEKNPRLMLKRLPEEEGGTYYRMYIEGRIRNYDGYSIKIAGNKEGLDLNRNYPFEWAGEHAQLGAGDFPLSEPETRAVVEFWSKHKNIGGSQSYHTFSGVILRPYSGHADDYFPKEDLAFYKLLGKRGTQYTGYPDVSIFHGFRYDPKMVLHGAFLDWAYDERGVFSISTELWDVIKLAGIEKRDFIDFMSRERSEEDDLKIMKWFEDNLPGSFEDWRAFDHPELGAVEIGGFNLTYTWSNPPAGTNWLKEIAQGNMLFSFAAAQMLPRLSMPVFKTEKIGDALFKVVVVVENSGYLPTYVTKKAVEKRLLKPITLEIMLGEGAELVSGLAKQEVGQLEGRSNKGSISPQQFGYNSDYRAKAEWLVRAKSGTSITVEVFSERGGKFSQTTEM
jgi:murein tripeptide amidase MpaA